MNTSSAAPATWPRLERGYQRCIIHEFAARAVDDAHALLHRGERLGVDHAGGLRRETDVERDVVRAGKELVERDQANAVFARNRGRHKRIASDDFESEAACAPRHFKPDAAQAENAERLAAQFRALQALLLPLARVHRGVG